MPIGQRGHENGGVVASESKAVAHPAMELALAWHARRVVQITQRIWIFKIDGWRDDFVADGQHCQDKLDTATCAQQVPQLALGAGNADVAGVLAKDALDSGRF